MTELFQSFLRIAALKFTSDLNTDGLKLTQPICLICSTHFGNFNGRFVKTDGLKV